VARAKLGFWYRLAVVVLKPLAVTLTKREWHHEDLLPREGGIIVVPNHISYVDPIVVAHYLYANGRPPCFLIKDGMFTIPVIGRVLKGAGQIPVYRKSRQASESLHEAAVAVERGECVVVYIEGTITRDPDGWPMAAKTGAARIALETGAPVIPLAQWGAQRMLPAGSVRPRLFPRTRVKVQAGPPIDLDDLRGQPITGELLREATARMTAAVTGQLSGLRGEAPPEKPHEWDDSKGFGFAK
jgi:1-acyl-sn-glycerol-3-phosphate acyltransferase